MSMLAGATQQQRIELQQNIDRFEGRIRRRLRGKLAAVASRVYDEDDVMASMRRRADLMLVRGNLAAQTPNALEAYMQRIAHCVVADELRRRRREERKMSVLVDLMIARHQSSRMFDHDDRYEEIAQHLLKELDQRDRDALVMWSRGASHQIIAKTLNFSFEAWRSRWRRIREAFRQQLPGYEAHPSRLPARSRPFYRQ